MADQFLPIMRPLLGEREAAAAQRVVLSGWVTQGPEVAAFEQEFAQAVGAEHAVAVSSCTAALHLALHVFGIGPGDEVIVPSHSFIATANAIRYRGATPVFAEIERTTYNLDPQRVADSVTDRTRAILCVHQMGMPCNVEAMLDIGRRTGTAVIEDAACATGSRIRWGGAWESIGRPHGDIACFSFHPRKVITAGEGGMLTTSDPAVAARLRRLRQHGMSLPDAVRHRSRRVVFESYDELGYNYRMSDIQAAVCRVQLERLEEIVALRRELADRYGELLEGTPVERPQEPEWARSNWQSYCVRLPAESDQKTVMQRMLDRSVATRRGIMCAHREPAYRGNASITGPGSLSESEKAADACILLPLFHQLTAGDQERVVEALRQSL